METLFLPGMDGTGKLFASLQRLIVPELNPRVVVYPPNQARSYDELLDDIAIPAGPFAVVAESFSGPLGIRLANKHPSQLQALILVASFVRNPSIVATLTNSLFGRQLFRFGIPNIALRFLLLGMDSTNEEVRDLRSVLLSVEPDVLANRLQEITSVDVSNEFAEGTVPVLYLAGSRDRLVGTSVMMQMKRIRPNMRTHVLDAPHLVLQRRPEESARLISDFLLSKHD